MKKCEIYSSKFCLISHQIEIVFNFQSNSFASTSKPPKFCLFLIKLHHDHFQITNTRFLIFFLFFRFIVYRKYFLFQIIVIIKWTSVKIRQKLPKYNLFYLLIWKTKANIYVIRCWLIFKHLRLPLTRLLNGPNPSNVPLDAFERTCEPSFSIGTIWISFIQSGDVGSYLPRRDYTCLVPVATKYGTFPMNKISNAT